MNTSMYQSTKHRSIFQSPGRHTKIEPRRMESYRKSVRKPIFDNSFCDSSNKKTKLMRPPTVTEPTFHHIQYQQSVHDDFCGCEHNLEPCAIVRQLLNGLNEKDMRQEYEQLERGSASRSKFQLRKKYFKYLPLYYPEIYHAQLTNILANMDETLSFNEFITLAWIEYHAKFQHITYFLFSDLKKAQKTKKKFFENLEISLIAYEVNFNSLIQESISYAVPLTSFMEHYYETFGANIIPISQYGKFIRILLRRGYKQLTSLLILLIASKKETLFELLKSYSSGTIFRQKSRGLLWQQFFEEITIKRTSKR